MKKKFILLAMMLLTLIGGVKFNVLNAQETITIGSGTEQQAFIPIQANYDNTISEQIFLAEDFQGNTGNIESYAFKSSKDLVSYGTTITVTRNFKIYMINTDKASFVGKTDWVNMTSADMVFDGTVTVQPKDTWTTITFDTPFEYENGKNVLLCIVAEGDWVNVSGNYYKYPTTEVRSLIYYEDRDATPLDATNITDESKFDNLNYVAQSQFTFEDNTPAVMPSSVPEITSEATHNSVTLSWNEVENAKKYNVYTSTGDLVTTVSETSCTIENLDELTEYCYQVSAVNGEYETAKSAVSCVTTLEVPGTRNVVFVLHDTYGDSWNGGKLSIKVNGVDYKTLANENLDNINNNSNTGGETQTHTLTFNIGDEVTLEYTPSRYPSENNYHVYYDQENGEEIFSGNGDEGVKTYTFTVSKALPVLLIEASAYEIYSDQTATLTATTANFDGDVAYSWSLNGEIVGTDATYTFDPSAAGIYTFTCTATDANDNEASASVTINVTERPALALDVTADKTEIYQGQNTMLYADATGGFPNYTFNWSLNGEEYGTGSSFYFYQTEVGEYTITCKVTDANGGTIEKSVTVNVLANPFFGKQFRVKVMEGSYAGQYLNVNSHYIVTSPSNWNQDASTRVGVSQYQESNSQKFTIEMYDSQRFYLRDADGYLIKCDDQTNNYGRNTWDVDAYSTTLGTPLWFDYVGEEQFYIRDYDKYLGNGSTANHSTTNNYFKVQDGLVYCDAPIDINENEDENHMVVLWSLEEVLPAVENLVANPTKLYPGETTTLTWGTFEGAARYNIYVNGELKYNTTETSYELSGLTYNVNGNTIEVIAVDENNVEIGKASVTVQVAGTFTLTVNVTDGTKPIEDATVNIDMAYAYDEFKNQISPVTVEPTGADGKTTVELLRLPNEGFYDDNSNWVNPFYTVEVSKSPYQDNNWNYINYYEDVTSGYTMDVELALPTVSNIQVQDEKGEDLHGDVMEGTKVVLSWDAVEGADSYKVYTFENGEVESSETVTGTTCTIEGVLKGYQYAVSALFGELESVKTTATIDVKGNGYFKGYVTDGTNALQGIQVKVSSEYGDASVVVTTDESGYFEGEIMEGNYILTISHSDYEEFTLETFAIGYGTEYDFETITLTAKPSASDITGVTATLNGENVDVEWTVNETSTYTKYNVYRRLAGTQGKGDNIATEVTTTRTTDAAWETLEPGTYQYGVSAFVEPQAQTRGTEVIFEEGFDNNGGDFPEGWNRNNTSQVDLTSVSIYKYEGAYGCFLGGSSSTTYSLTSPNINLTSGKLTLNFYNRNGFRGNTTTNINVKRTNESSWTTLETINETHSGFTLIEVDLSNYANEIIKLQFEVSCVSTGYSCIDEISIVAESSEVETQIVWSNKVVKQGPATFIGGDTENPTAWNVDANWSTGSVPADGAEVTINANAVISSAVNVSNLTINQGDSYPYNKLTVANGGTLTVTGTITQTTSNLLVLEEGGQIFQNNEGVKAGFRMSIDTPSDWSTSNKDGWQFISMPMADVTYDWFTGADEEYDLYKYDGSQELEWLNHKAGSFAETEFISGKGYLASLKDNTTATVYGTLNAATSQQWGPYYMYDKDFANLQLIGNPFTFDIKWSDFAISGVYYDSELEEVIDNVPYFVDGYAIVDNNGNYQYYTSADNESIKVGQGFFVKLLATQVSLKYNKTRTITRESNNSLNITATGNAGKDNVVINFAGKSEGFDKLQNFNDAIATVYVAEDGKNYGIYNCDADVQEVELSFNANKMGNYTISIEPNGKFETVTLVDRFTGVETNMLVEDYNFTAMSSDNHNRFIVRFANGQESTDNSHFVYQSGEELILNIQGEVQIVDVLGRVVYNGEAMNDINRINVSSFNSGAYMVKVMNGNEVKVEKVVIY